MRIPRLYKFLIGGFLTYAVATARPETQGEIVEGGLAIKDAAIEACQREGSLCSEAIAWMGTTVSQSLTDGDPKWMDDPAARGGGTVVMPGPAAQAASDETAAR